MTERAAALRPGYQLGRYQLLMPLAKGGMGQVWAARLTGTRGFQKLVAIKTLLPTDEDLQQLELMLFEEASLASRIKHPNVAETLDLGEQDGTLYLVMEWVNGESLDYILRVTRPQGVPIPIGIHLLEQACRGLHSAHQARDENGQPLEIVHRDVSPQNLLVTYTGATKLIDFGVAKASSKVSAPTELGHVKGKFAYMSPEQIQGDPLDARADVFAMGIVLYRTTTGVHPYKADNPAATVRNVLLTTPQRPSEIVPGYPTPLEQVVMKALSLDRDQRFATAEEMAMALDRSLPPVIRANGQKSTEAFLRKLFEQRMAERTQALSKALRAADVGRSISDPKFVMIGLPGSQSTMRGVAMDPQGPAVSVTEPSDQSAPTPPETVPRSRPRRRRMAATGLAIAAGFASYLASRPELPHHWFPASAARPSAPADRGSAIAVPPPPGSTAPATAPRGSPEAHDKVQGDPTVKDAKEAAHPPAAPTTPRAAAKKRDKQRRPDARDNGRSSSTVNPRGAELTASAPSPMSPPSQPAEAPSAPPDPPAEDSDPLLRQK